MSLLEDLYRHQPLGKSSYWLGGGYFNELYDSAHGGLRYLLSQIPIYGWSRRILDDANYAEDYYRNTGEDPLYMRRYGSNAGGSIGGLASPLSQIPKMARSLAALYPAEVKEDLANSWKDAWKMKRESYYASAMAANAWNDAWNNKR